MTRQVVQTDRIAAPIGPFSLGVIGHGNFYASGQIALDPETGQLVAGGVSEQTEQILQNLTRVLEAAGRTSSDVLKVNVYLADMDDFAAMNAIYERHFTAPFPARTTIQAAKLPMGANVEIELIAQ
jgi:2-iminobutanoate/2-iminopropanoate deaminase